MATTIQTIELPKKARALDTSSSLQPIGGNLLAGVDFEGITQAEDTSGAIWVTGLGWTIGSGVASCDGSQSASSNMYNADDDLLDPENKFWEITFTVTAYTAGNIRAQIGGYGPLTEERDATGTYTEIVGPIHSSSQNRLYLKASSDFIGSVDNVVVRLAENFPNNNHGQIYSGRGLEFDGVSDHLVTGYGNGLNPYTTPVTVAIWAKTAAAGGEIFIGPTSGSNQRFYIGYTDGVWDMGIQNSAWATTTNEVSGFSDQPRRKVDTWYRIVVVMSAGQATMYVNGVKSYAKTYTSYVFNSDITIGNFDPTTNYYWNGMLSDAQIWDAAFTQADVTYDYLNPESLALNNGGTALTESNLKLWYPMQDGHRGQQSYILDGANTGLVSYLVNSDFSTNTTSDYSVSTTRGDISHEDSSFMRFTYNSSNGSGLLGPSTLISGKTYRIKFRAKGTHATAFTGVGNNGDLGNVTSNPVLTTDWQDYEFLITANSTYMRFYQDIHGSGGTTLDIDDITVQAINDKNHATTVFYGDELITNGTFETNTTGWSNLSGATFERNTSSPITGSGDMHWVASGTSYTAFKHDAAIPVVAGRSYKLEYDYRVVGTDYISAKLATTAAATGTLLSGFTETELDETSNTSVSYTFTSGATDDVYLVFRSGDGVSPEIYVDNISVKEVGVATGWTDADQQLHIPQTALQSYNELAWFDGIADYVQLSDPYNHNLITISAWVYISQDTTAHKCVFSNRDSGDDGLLLTVNGDEKVYAKFNGTAVISNTVLSIGDWHHIVYTYDDTTMKVYINGVLDNSGTFTASNMDVTANANIGKGTQAGYYFPGSITEVSTWASALSLAEIQELYNDGKALDATIHSKAITASTNLKGYFRNNGLSTWTDLSDDYSNNGAPTSVTETILIPQGVDSTRDNQGFLMNKQKDTSCLNIDGIGYASLPTMGVSTDDFSIEVWAKTSQMDNISESVILEVGASMLLFGGSTTYIRAVDGAFTNQLPSHSFASDSWYHIVVTRIRNGNQIMYVDAVAKNTVTAPDTAMTLAATTIGKDGTTRVSRNMLDGINIYSKALSAAEVLRNYNATKGSHRN